MRLLTLFDTLRSACDEVACQQRKLGILPARKDRHVGRRGRDSVQRGHGCLRARPGLKSARPPALLLPLHLVHVTS